MNPCVKKNADIQNISEIKFCFRVSFRNRQTVASQSHRYRNFWKESKRENLSFWLGCPFCSQSRINSSRSATLFFSKATFSKILEPCGQWFQGGIGNSWPGIWYMISSDLSRRKRNSNFTTQSCDTQPGLNVINSLRNVSICNKVHHKPEKYEHRGCFKPKLHLLQKSNRKRSDRFSSEP